jgi:hypothetical protein
MADKDKIEERYHYEFVHNVFGSFFKSTLDYFSEYLYPRFNYTMIGTYDKAVAYLTKKEELDREVDKPNLPALILNPTGDISDADTGRQFFRFPNLAPGFIKRVFDPVYQDENVLVTVGFSRVGGEIELLMLMNSFYEYCDLRMYLLQIFGGKDRVIHPQYFDSWIILPSEVYNFKYENEYTGESYTLNWESAGVSQQVVKTTNKSEWVLPVHIKPWYKMTAMTDPSSRYGGVDKLADWRLGVTVVYEVEIPTFIVLEYNYLAKYCKMNVKYGSTYSKYQAFEPETDITVTKLKYDYGLSEQDNSQISDGTASIEYIKTLVFKTRYFHIITQEAIDSGEDIEIVIPETVIDHDLIRVNSIYGKLNYGDHYTISDNGLVLTIKVANVQLQKDMLIEMYIYELTSQK